MNRVNYQMNAYLMLDSLIDLPTNCRAARFLMHNICHTNHLNTYMYIRLFHVPKGLFSDSREKQDTSQEKLERSQEKRDLSHEK